jgi:hypothetical protein
MGVDDVVADLELDMRQWIDGVEILFQVLFR